ncbi:MAG: 4a-hydroxytetrahydrobiopterin dehydratase [Pyrinomonadaceae bacterium]|nr:4a-hydroxytetrahydrobiopterin dehydratase [Pyrinomonadaceae bacterium]
MARKKLSAEEIAERIGELKSWATENDNLKKRFAFANFAEALEFVNKVGAIAEKRDHHPDIAFGWGYAEFAITTHDAGGLTHNDFDLAKEIEKSAEN